MLAIQIKATGTKRIYYKIQYSFTFIGQQIQEHKDNVIINEDIYLISSSDDEITIGPRFLTRALSPT